jgi:hypothetical protein
VIGMQSFFAGLARTAGSLGDPLVGLYLILAVALTFLSTMLGRESLKKRFPSDLAAMLAYFGVFFLLLFAAPVAWLLAVGRPSGLTPAALGLRVGDWRVGLVSILVAAPLLAITLFNSSRDPVIRGWYPFSKGAAKSAGRLFIYEAAYIVLYYLAWDFAFRGLVQMSLARLLPAGLQGTIVAILVQTALSTIFHLGHPDSEIWGAFAVGIIFGVITAATGSILYSFVIHAIVGVGNDLYITHLARQESPRRGRRASSTQGPLGSRS